MAMQEAIVQVKSGLRPFAAVMAKMCAREQVIIGFTRQPPGSLSRKVRLAIAW